MSQSPLEQGADGQDDYIGGWRDLYAQVDAGSSWSGRERHCAFLNVGTSRFANVAAVSGIDVLDDGRGLTPVDWDHDGDLDLWFSNRTGPTLRLLDNRGAVTGHWLGLRPVGRSCQRDAIGARVEVWLPDASRPAAITTVRAGEGFRTQSGSWLHFGLANAGVIARVVVRWPGGEAEEFRGLSVDGYYVLAEGTGRANLWQRPAATIALEPSEFAAPPLTEQARIVLATRVPMPSLDYRTAADAMAPVELSGEGPLLISLWASWCPLCMQELRDLTSRGTELSDQGIRVLALNVDGLSDATEASAEDPLIALTTMGFPFLSGRATEELFTKLQLLSEHVVARRRPLPAPCSFLVGPDGQLISIYKGPVSVDQLLVDAELAYAVPDQIRDFGVPFPGRWLFPATFANLGGLARTWSEAGFEADALACRQAEIEMYASQSMQAARERAALLTRQLAIEYNERGSLAAKSNDLAAAEAALREALRLEPGFAEAHNNLGTVLFALGRLDEAIAAFEQALRSRPDFADAARNLEAARASLRGNP